MKTQTKSKKVNKAWLHDHLNDPYVKQAQRDGYRARAAYKLKEIDEELHLLKPGQLVVDLGAAPGAWSQYVRRKFAPKEAGSGGAAAGQLERHDHRARHARFRADRGRRLPAGRFPRGRGAGPARGAAARAARSTWWSPTWRRTCRASRASDAARMAHLVELAVEFAQKHLAPQGALVCKVFHGSGYSQLVKLFKNSFRSRQADQAEGLARQIGRNLSGRYRSEADRGRKAPAWQ